MPLSETITQLHLAVKYSFFFLTSAVHTFCHPVKAYTCKACERVHKDIILALMVMFFWLQWRHHRPSLCTSGQPEGLYHTLPTLEIVDIVHQFVAATLLAGPLHQAHPPCLQSQHGDHL